MRRFAVVVVAPLFAVSLVSSGCEVPTPLAPAEPIGEFPVWGADFNTPKEQPSSNLGMPGMMGAAGDGAANTSSTGAAMPGALKSFAGGDPVVGKGIYVTLCARCHGDSGEGGALPGGIAVPAFQDPKVQGALSDGQMARAIALGKGSMPGFMQDLDRDKLAAVIAYIRTLQKK